MQNVFLRQGPEFIRNRTNTADFSLKIRQFVFTLKNVCCAFLEPPWAGPSGWRTRRANRSPTAAVAQQPLAHLRSACFCGRSSSAACGRPAAACIELRRFRDWLPLFLPRPNHSRVQVSDDDVAVALAAQRRRQRRRRRARRRHRRGNRPPWHSGPPRCVTRCPSSHSRNPSTNTPGVKRWWELLAYSPPVGAKRPYCAPVPPAPGRANCASTPAGGGGASAPRIRYS